MKNPVNDPIDNEKLANLVGKRIQVLRESKQVTKVDLAKSSGISRTSLTKIEAGAQLPQLPALYVISKILDVAISELLPNYQEVEVADPLFNALPLAAQQIIKEARDENEQKKGNSSR
jgi:transcriptional regulator with XRE-family HTH domain